MASKIRTHCIPMAIILLGPPAMSMAQDEPPRAPMRVMATGVWHKVKDGEPIADSTIKESAYIVLDDDHHGKASFQIALVPGDDILDRLRQFQKITRITSGNSQAVFNVDGTVLNQWAKPIDGDPLHNHVGNFVKEPREGLMVCLMSGATKGSAKVPDPHCHTMIAGFDSTDPEFQKAANSIPVGSLTGGYPGTGGHLGPATVHVVAEIHVDSYPEVIEKTSGGLDLGGYVMSISKKQEYAARKLLQESISNPSPGSESK